MENQALPLHVGIIMDGNGRWAKARGLTRTMGHRQGANAFREIVRHAGKRGISYLTVYAFSTENWKRPAEEVRSIMDLLRSYLGEVKKHVKENIRLRILGDRRPLDEDIQRLIAEAEEDSSSNTGMTLNIALNYGGRDEILHAVRAVAAKAAAGELSNPEEITEEVFSQHLYTAGQPDVDLIIRTSGEYRISNFLTWQGVYAEYIFSDVLWPDFSPKHFEIALAEFASRTRRLGGI